MDVCVVDTTGVRRVSTEAASRGRRERHGHRWIDLGYDEREGMRLLVDLLHARPDDVDDCFNRLPVPKLHAYADHYFSAINGLARGTDGRLYFQPLKIFFTANVLITVMGPTSAASIPTPCTGTSPSSGAGSTRPSCGPGRRSTS